MVGVSSILLLILTTVVHYEALHLVSIGLPMVRIPARAKLIVVILAAFVSHGAQIFLYGLAYYVLSAALGDGSLGHTTLSLINCVYFSAETFTTIGFGDIIAKGPLRLLVGVEALNGLLLIGWSASFVYISMERFWAED